MATKVKSVEHLKEILSNGDGRDFFIRLNFGARSSKFVSWDSGENIFYVLNYIDDSEQELTEEMLSSYLFSADVPDPELIIRPSGEKRTSNFLLWQSAYSEYVFMNVLWPDFAPEHLDEAIEEYHRRNRRFGGT